MFDVRIISDTGHIMTWFHLNVTGLLEIKAMTSSSLGFCKWNIFLDLILNIFFLS